MQSWFPFKRRKEEENMEIALRALGLDVLPADADAQVDQAFRLSGLLSGQVEVRIRPDNLPAAFQQFAAWVCCQRNAQTPSKLYLSATSPPSVLYYNLPLMRRLLGLTGDEEVLVTGTCEGWNGEMLVVTLS
jgi:hypothetical protein